MASVGRLDGTNETTVRCIQMNKKAIQESVVASDGASTEVVTHIRDVHIERVEKAQCMD